MGHSRSHDLRGIILSFPRLSPTIGHVVHVLLSSPPRLLSRLACLNRIPIAVAAGRINRSQILLTNVMMMNETETGSLPCFTLSRDGTLMCILQMSVSRDIRSIERQSVRVHGCYQPEISALHLSQTRFVWRCVLGTTPLFGGSI